MNSLMNVPPGKTVCIQAGRYDHLRFIGFVGTSAQPIRFINCGGQVSVGIDAYYSGIQFEASRYFVLSGSGDSNYQYGFKLDKSNADASGLSIGVLSSDCEVERVEVAKAGFAGFFIKTDPTCDPTTWREKFTMYNVKLHDNYIHDTGGEGMYIGNSFYSGVNVTCNGAVKVVYPHLIQGLEVYNNRIEHTGAEGLQYGCAPDAQVHHNHIDYAGISPFAKNQNNGLQISGGSGGDCYSNIIRHVAGTGLAILGQLGNNRIYNNVIYDVGQDGIFCDDRPGSVPNTTMAFLNNTISKAGRDGIRLYNEINVNTIANNVITQPNAIPALGGRPFVFQQGARADMVANFVALNTASAGFVDVSADSADFRLTPCSPLIRAGVNVSSWGVLSDLDGKLRDGAYDIGAYSFNPDSLNTTPIDVALACLNQRLALVIVYPSPTSDQVTLLLPEDQFIDQIHIYNSMGQRVINQLNTQGRTNTQTISVAHLPTGHYFFDIFINPSDIIRGRFIKQ